MPNNGVNSIISWGRDGEGPCTSRRALGESTHLLNIPSCTNPLCNMQPASRLQGTTCPDWLHLKAFLILICVLSQQQSKNLMSLRSLSNYTELETAKEVGSMNLSLSSTALSGFNVSSYAANLKEIITRKVKFI